MSVKTINCCNISLYPPPEPLPHFGLFSLLVLFNFLLTLLVSAHPFSLYAFRWQQQLRLLPQSVHPFPFVSTSTPAFIDSFLKLTPSLPSHQCHYYHFPPFLLLYFTPTSLDWSSPSFTAPSSPFIHPAFLYFLLFSDVLALYISFHYHHTIMTYSPHSPILFTGCLSPVSPLYPLTILLSFSLPIHPSALSHYTLSTISLLSLQHLIISSFSAVPPLQPILEDATSGSPWQRVKQCCSGSSIS